MATKSVMTPRQKFRTIWTLGRERLAGRITQQSLEEEIRAVLTAEPELPLGVGAVMPEAKK